MIDDIRDRRRALSSTSALALAAQASMYRRSSAWKAEATEDENDLKGFMDTSRIPAAKVLEYNGWDAVRTAQVDYDHINVDKALEDPRIHRLYLQQMRLAKVASKMMFKGIPINETKRWAMSHQLTETAKVRAKKFLDMTSKYGPIRIKIGTGKTIPGSKKKDTGKGVSERDLRALIYEECKVPHIKGFNLPVPFHPMMRTETGLAAVNKRALLWLFSLDNTPEELKQIIYQVWLTNAPLKGRNTYLESGEVLSRIDHNGWLHASINSAGAATGRWTSSEPNLFNIPEEKEENESIRGEMPDIRDIYEAPPGYAFFHVDMKSFEPNVLWDITDDPGLATLLNSPENFHEARARMFGMVPPGAEKVPKAIKRLAKEAGLGYHFHAGLETLFLKVLERDPHARMIDVADVMHRFEEVHTGIVHEWEAAVQFGMLNGYINTKIMDRRYYFAPDEPVKAEHAVAYETQGTAADIANSCMVGIEEQDAKDFMFERLNAEHPKSHLALHVYDSFDVLGPIKDETKIMDLLLDCTSGRPYGGWKVGSRRRTYGADPKVGSNLGAV